MNGNASTNVEFHPTKVAKKLDDLFVTAVEQYREWLKSPGHPMEGFAVFRNIIWSLQFATKARSELLMMLWYDMMDLMRVTHNHRIREWTYEVLSEFASMRHHIEIVRENGGLCALREEYCREGGDFIVVSSGARVVVLTMLVRLTLYICYKVPELSTPILLDPKIYSMIEAVVFNNFLPKTFRTSVWERYLSVSRFAELQQKKLQHLRVQQLRNPHQYNSMLRQQQQQLRMQQQQIAMSGLVHASSVPPEAAAQTMMVKADEREVLQQLRQQQFTQQFMEQQTSVSQKRFAHEQGEESLQEAQQRFWSGQQVQTVPPHRQAQHLEQSRLSQLQAQRLQEAYRQEMLERHLREQQQRLLRAQRWQAPQEQLLQSAQHELSRADETGQAYSSREQTEKAKVVQQELHELLLEVFHQRPDSQQNGSNEALSVNGLDAETQQRSMQASYQGETYHQETHQQGSSAPAPLYQDLRNLQTRSALQYQHQRPTMIPPQQYQQNVMSYAPRSHLPPATQWLRNVPSQQNHSFAMPSRSQPQPPGTSIGQLFMQNQVTRPMGSEYGNQRQYPTNQVVELPHYSPMNAQQFAFQQYVHQQRLLQTGQAQPLQFHGAGALKHQGPEDRIHVRDERAQALNRSALSPPIAGTQPSNQSTAAPLQSSQSWQIDQEKLAEELQVKVSLNNSQSDPKPDSQPDPPQERKSKQPELWQLPCEDLIRKQMEEGYLELPDDDEENI